MNHYLKISVSSRFFTAITLVVSCIATMSAYTNFCSKSMASFSSVSLESNNEDAPTQVINTNVDQHSYAYNAIMSNVAKNSDEPAKRTINLPTYDSKAISNWAKEQRAMVKKQSEEDYVSYDDGKYHREAFSIAVLGGGGLNFYGGSVSGGGISDTITSPSASPITATNVDVQSISPNASLFLQSTIKMSETSFMYMQLNNFFFINDQKASAHFSAPDPNHAFNGGSISQSTGAQGVSGSGLGGYLNQLRILVGYDVMRFGENSAHVLSILAGGNAIYKNASNMVNSFSNIGVSNGTIQNLQGMSDGYGFGGTIGLRQTYRIDKKSSLMIDVIADADMLFFQGSSGLGAYFGAGVNVQYERKLTKYMSFVASLSDEFKIMLDPSVPNQNQQPHSAGNSGQDIFNFFNAAIGLSFGF